MREVMKFPSLRGSMLLAGSDGLDRIVVNAMVMEGPDVDRWAKPGLVLVTSFFALEPLTNDERLVFFEKIRDIGIAGIIYKPGRLRSNAIEQYIRICDELSIPIVQMLPEINFEAVLMDIMGLAIDSNATLLNTFYDVHRQIIKLALQQPNIRTIVKLLSTLIGCDVTYYDRGDNIRIGTNPNLDEFTSIDLQELHYQQYQSYRYLSVRITREGAAIETALAVLVPKQTPGSSYLIIHDEPDNVTAFMRMIIENYVSLLVLELIKQDAIEERLFSRNNMIVHDLLQDRYASHEEIDRAVRELGVDSHQLYQVMLLRISIDDPRQIDRMHDILTAFRRKIKRLYAQSVYFEASNRISFLRNHTSNTAGFDREAIEQILSDMLADKNLPAFTYLVALSGEEHRYAIGNLNTQVMGIYRLFDSDRLGNRFIDYESLGIYKFVIEMGDLSLIASYIDPRIMRLHKENPEAFETIVTLCECGQSYGAAAERLFIHQKTVRYRIGRIKEVYGIDVQNPDDVVQVLLANKITLLLGSDWEPKHDA